MKGKTPPINSTRAPYPQNPGPKIIKYTEERQVKVGSTVKKNSWPQKDAVKGAK